MADLPLTAGEITSMRASLESFLAGTAALLSPTFETDGQGGQTTVWGTAATVAARLAPDMLRGSEAVIAGRVAETSSWILTLPADTTVDETYRVEHAAVTYEVTEVLTRTPEELGRRVRLQEID